MTMAKKLPIFYPSIHTFELHGKYHSYAIMTDLFERIKELIAEGKYHRTKNKKKKDKQRIEKQKRYCYTKKGGGLKVELNKSTGHGDWQIILSGINLARIAGNPSRLALADLSPDGFNYQMQHFFMELEQLGLLNWEGRIEWILYRADVTQDFYVKCDPVLPIKLARYAGEAMPYGKGTEKHYDKHNEMRSGRFEKEEYDFEIYDKHKALLTDIRNGCPVSEGDLEESRNLIRCEIQLKRKFLLEFEKQTFQIENGQDRKLELQDIPYALWKLGERAPGILYDKTEKLFGTDPWYHAQSALKVLESSNLDESTTALVKNYIVSVNAEEQYSSYTAYQEAKIKRVLKQLAINLVIIPDKILNERQFARLPFGSFCSRVQNCEKNL